MGNHPRRYPRRRPARVGRGTPKAPGPEATRVVHVSKHRSDAGFKPSVIRIPILFIYTTLIFKITARARYNPVTFKALRFMSRALSEEYCFKSDFFRWLYTCLPVGPPTRDTCRDDLGRYELAPQTSKLSPSSPPRLAAHSVCRRCNDLWPSHRRRAFRAPPGTRCTTTVCAPLRGAHRQSDLWVPFCRNMF